MKRFVQCSLLLAAMLWGCVRDTDEIRLQEGIPFTVGEARSWFETYGEPEYRTGLSAFRATDSSYVELEPLLDWDLAELQEDSTWTVVELPWEYENGFVTMATPEMNCCQESLDEQKSSQVIRLVVMKNKTTDDIYGFKMVVIPDLNYLTMGGDQILSNTYLSRETDFYGLVMFYSIGGKFVNGWQYADGQIIAKINESDMEQDPSGMDGTRSSISWEYIEIETCYYHSVSIDGGITWSGARLSGCSYSYYAVMHVDYSDYNGGGIGGYYPAGGGGGGSGSTTPPIVDASKAKTIFRNSTMTEQNWEKIENMLDKMIENCLGSGLYNGLVTMLNGKTLSIQFNNSDNSSWFDAYTGNISLDMTIESNRLFHEMLHALQAYHETAETLERSKLNLEIEAWFAQYLYVQSLPEYKPGSKWHSIYNDTNLGEGIQDIKDHIDSKGNLIQDETKLYSHLAGIATLFREMPEYSETKYPYDYDRTAISNFSNLKRIAANCI